MKKLTKMLVGLGCAVVALFGSGCGVKRDEIFQGNYVEVSEQTVKNFSANVKTSKVTPQEIAKNNGGVRYDTRIMLLGFIKFGEAEMNILQNVDGSCRYKIKLQSFEEGVNDVDLVYGDGEYCYHNLNGQKTAHKKTPYYSGTCNLVTTTIGGLGVMFENQGKSQNVQYNVQYYMDTTDTKYTKIKAVGSEIIFSSSNQKSEQQSIERIWIYDKEYNLVACYSQMKVYGMKMIESYTPWSGTITPPDDLDSYVFEDR